MQYLIYLHRSYQSGFAGNCHPEEDQSCLRQRRSLLWDHLYTQPHQAVLDWAAFLHNPSLQRHQPARNHKGVKVSVYWYILSGCGLHLTPCHRMPIALNVIGSQVFPNQTSHLQDIRFISLNNEFNFCGSSFCTPPQKSTQLH